MIYIAFTLGLFGSLHCLGMCGPLAIAFCNKPNPTKIQRFFNALNYNLGRIFTYTFLGLIFGVIGSFFFIVDLQKYLSVFIGIILIASVIFSINVESKISQVKFINRFNHFIKTQISTLISISKTKSTFSLGIINGLLPCGLVYLAVAGSLSVNGALSGAVFMMAFGFGTLPALFFLILGSSKVSPKIRFQFRKLIPVVNVLFGVFLIYRGLVVDMPTELNFWEALKNPLMCH